MRLTVKKFFGTNLLGDSLVNSLLDCLALFLITSFFSQTCTVVVKWNLGISNVDANVIFEMIKDLYWPWTLNNNEVEILFTLFIFLIILFLGGFYGFVSAKKISGKYARFLLVLFLTSSALLIIYSDIPRIDSVGMKTCPKFLSIYGWVATQLMFLLLVTPMPFFLIGIIHWIYFFIFDDPNQIIDENSSKKISI